MARLIVERSFDPPITDEELESGARILDGCLEQHGARWLSSYLSSDRRRMICEFEAADAEAVRASHRSAAVGFERVWSADVYRLGEPDAK
jgi:hypothetical protein